MHLVEISTKSTKNMGYAQVTQSPGFNSEFIEIERLWIRIDLEKSGIQRFQYWNSTIYRERWGWVLDQKCENS